MQIGELRVPIGEQIGEQVGEQIGVACGSARSRDLKTYGS